MQAQLSLDPRIDRVRGLLAIGVMLGHTCDVAWSSNAPPHGMVYQIVGGSRPFLGFVCVIGFIVLSGYCITRSTMKQQPFQIGRYGLMRITRLYPVMIIATLIAGVFEWIMFGSAERPILWNSAIDLPHFRSALFGLSGFEGQFGSLAPTYTVSYELFYYAAWGAALLVAGGRHRIGFALAAAGAVGLLLLGEYIRVRFGPPLAFYLHPLCIALLPAWLIGSGLAIFFETIAKVARFIPPLLGWIALAAMVIYGYDSLKQPTLGHQTPDIQFYVGLSSVLAFALAAWLCRPAPVPNRTDRWLGELSYPLFLIHGPMIIFVQFLINSARWEPGFNTALAVLVGINLLAAVLLVVAVERPVMEWRRKLRRSNSVTPLESLPDAPRRL